MPHHYTSYSATPPASRSHRHRESPVSLADHPKLEGTRNGRILTVTESQHGILKKANKAIEDTWKALDKGSGNQIHDAIYTRGESIKRTLATQTTPTTHETHPYTAARFRAGNCADMASVNALMLASSGINEPVALCYAMDADHGFVMIGDRRANGERLYSDAWPLFGRADKEQNYDLSKRYRIVKEYAPQAPDPSVRERLIHGEKASHTEVNDIYRRAMRDHGTPISKEDVNSLKHIARRHHKPVYTQLQASRNVNMYYQTESGGEATELKPEMKRSVYESRQRRLDAATRSEVRDYLHNINRGV